MVPADAQDLKKEFEILYHELEKFNPELLHKQRILAITKADMLDEELMEEMRATLPTDIPHMFISSVSGYNIQKLKDTIWQVLNEE